MRQEMKQIIMVNAHSVVDVITNSSSELFVVHGNKTIEQIEAILRKLVDNYNANQEIGAYDKYSCQISYDECFGDIYIYTKEMCAEDEAEADRCQKQYGDDCTYGYEGRKENIGKIFIESKSDNTIPYEMFDMIHNIFNTSRYHLG
jgi:hypothetical protein